MQACVYHDFVCICNVCLLYMCIRVNKNGKIFLYACSDKWALYKWVGYRGVGLVRALLRGLVDLEISILV